MGLAADCLTYLLIKLSLGSKWVLDMQSFIWYQTWQYSFGLSLTCLVLLLLFCVFCFFVCFETGALYYVALSVLELAIQTKLASNSQKSTCLCVPSVGIKGIILYGARPRGTISKLCEGDSAVTQAIDHSPRPTRLPENSGRCNRTKWETELAPGNRLIRKCFREIHGR